ncbi:MAG: hypothetical protein J1G04_03880 [Clostridiales bacterium]|nr:hypothetical protein [Clostridiales bacterium]
MSNNAEELKYDNRDLLDSELVGAITDILSAEAQARVIIEQAEVSANAVRLDGATRERNLREAYERENAAYRDRVIAEAKQKADAQCKKLIEDACAQGDKLVKEKQPIIKKRAAELLDSIRTLGE